MATFREIVYMALDLLKERGDDAYYTEEHMVFLASHFRTYLLERKYRKSRNKAFQEVSGENTQLVCLSLEKTDMLDGCGGAWLRSKEEIPDTMDIMQPNIFPVSELIHSMVTLIPAERMPYVGYNKWLRNIIYAAIGADNHLYLSSVNSQFQFLKKIKMDAVFVDPEKAAELACDENGEGLNCEILDQDFPLESALIPNCVELMVQEIAGPRYAPEDKSNNAKDELGEVGLASARPSAPTENYERRAARREAAEDAE